MKTKAYIVEDEIANAEILEHFLTKYCPEIELVGTSGKLQEAKEQIEELKPNLLLVDIMLEDGTGFDLLDQIEDTVQVIFITAYSEYAIKAFKYSAIDYLLKPIQIDQLKEAISKVFTNEDSSSIKMQMDILRQQLMGVINQADDFIAIPMIDKIEMIKRNTIVSIKAEGKYSTFLLSDGRSIVSSRNLGEYEELLTSQEFFRVHNSFIINLVFVKEIIKTDGLYCNMEVGESVPVSRRKKDLLMSRLSLK